jgi:phage shock protein PspC (stress-responsive transcriptional regulator)
LFFGRKREKHYEPEQRWVAEMSYVGLSYYRTLWISPVDTLRMRSQVLRGACEYGMSPMIEQMGWALLFFLSRGLVVAAYLIGFCALPDAHVFESATVASLVIVSALLQ